MKLWGGRFTENTSKIMEEFNASISFDKRMYKEDIAGSCAHCKMLAKQGIIADNEKDIIIEGLKKIEKEIDNGEFVFSISDEDIHMSIEKRLIQIVGAVGGKLHTARSRNDQVAVDVRLYLRREVSVIKEMMKSLQHTIVI